MDVNQAKLTRLHGLGTPLREPFDPSSLRRGVLLRAEVGTLDPRLWTQVRRGWWMGKAEWDGLTPADLLAARAHATHLSSTKELVFSHFTAAALLGLPVFSTHQVVDVLAEHRHGSLSNVQRHFSSQSVATVRCGDLLVTSPARTVVDIARSSFVEGLICADQALRHRLCTMEDLLREAARIPRTAAGRVRAMTVVQLADPLSMSPGESYSRALMFLHGIPRPELQIHLEDDAGEIGFGDFGWQRLLQRPLVVGEFDGQYKYGVNTALSSEEVARRLMREKDRENRIRLAGPVVVRWTWADLMNPQQFLKKLRAVGVQPGTGAPWIIDDAA